MIGFDVGSFVGQLGGAAIGGAYQSRNTDRVNTMNKEIAEMTNASNERIAQQNLAFQRENLEYQKALQQQLFEREDTSYQRTVEDMKNAGLSPLSMQSTNGAGDAIATNALNNDMQYQGYNAQGTDYSSYVQSAVSALSQLSDQIFQRDSLKAQAEIARANARKTNAEAELIESKLPYKDKFAKGELFSSIGRGWSDFYSGSDKMSDSYYKQSFGLFDSMTDNERQAQILSKMLGLSNGFGFEHDDSSFVKPNKQEIVDLTKGMQKVYTAISVGSALKDLLPSFSFSKKLK